MEKKAYVNCIWNVSEEFQQASICIITAPLSPSSYMIILLCIHRIIIVGWDSIQLREHLGQTLSFTDEKAKNMVDTCDTQGYWSN
jgi:hypothetical protein